MFKCSQLPWHKSFSQYGVLVVYGTNIRRQLELVCSAAEVRAAAIANRSCCYNIDNVNILCHILLNKNTTIIYVISKIDNQLIVTPE